MHFWGRMTTRSTPLIRLHPPTRWRCGTLKQFNTRRKSLYNPQLHPLRRLQRQQQHQRAVMILLCMMMTMSLCPVKGWIRYTKMRAFRPQFQIFVIRIISLSPFYKETQKFLGTFLLCCFVTIFVIMILYLHYINFISFVHRAWGSQLVFNNHHTPPASGEYERPPPYYYPGPAN